LATKLKSTICRWQFKLLAHLIIIIAGTGFLWSVYHIGSEWEYLRQDNFYDTWDFENNYTRLVHNVLEKELVLIDEENVRAEYDDSEETNQLERLRRINHNLELAKSFKYLLVNTQTKDVKSNDSKLIEASFDEMETAMQWSTDQILFPDKSLLGNSRFGRDISSGYYSYTTEEDIFSMLERGPYKLFTAFDININSQDSFFGEPYHQFQQAHKMASTYYFLLVISLFLGLGGLIYLSIYTGKGREGERIKLYWLDYIPYEFQIGFLLLFTLIPLNISSSIYDPKEQYFLLIILCGILNIWVLLAIHIFLSMIRNLKNQRLGHNILCVRILMGMINMFKNMIKSYKPWLIIVFFGICLINMIFALLIPSGPFSVFAGFVLFNVLVLKVLVRYLRGLQYLMDATRARARGGLEYPLNVQELPEAFQDFGADLNAMQSGLRAALEEAMRGERMKTELITNVTHDLKNPLTSIINYVDLLKKEDMPSEEAKGYIAVLEDKAKRLKDLISHVVEASKASSGNIEINKEVIDIKQLMQQILAEYEDEFEGAQLDVVMQVADEPVTMNTDSKVMYRIIENLVTNIHKYSMRGSRVYITIGLNQEKAVIEMKNISKDPLNINTEALMERFVRGDASRNMEGSGLGLSIARSLAKALDLNLTIEIDGDLFKTKLT